MVLSIIKEKYGTQIAPGLLEQFYNSLDKTKKNDLNLSISETIKNSSDQKNTINILTVLDGDTWCHSGYAYTKQLERFQNRAKDMFPDKNTEIFFDSGWSGGMTSLPYCVVYEKHSLN